MTDDPQGEVELHCVVDVTQRAQDLSGELLPITLRREVLDGVPHIRIVTDPASVLMTEATFAALRPSAGADTNAQNMRVSAGAGEIEALRTILGILDDPTGGTHVEDMRAASEVARKAIASLTAPAPGVQTEALEHADDEMEMPYRPPGAYVIAGTLFFSLPDGSAISCECIGEPHASQIAAITTAAPGACDSIYEECAKIAKIGWITADYDTVGIADADATMKLCEHIAAEIRAAGEKK